MEKSYIDISKLSLDELLGVVNFYPWFALARKELCSRMLEVAGDSWGNKQYADTAFYCPSRKRIYDLLKSKREQPIYKDEDIEKILTQYIELHPNEVVQNVEGEVKTVRGATIVEKAILVNKFAGGDYFSAEAYTQMPVEDNNIFNKAMQRELQNSQNIDTNFDIDDFCTETLAQIYWEQGYYDKAKAIYSKLILRFPEKSIYFANLIDKLEEEI